MEEHRKRPRFSSTIRNMLLFVALLFILDFAVVKIWAPYLRQNIFLRQSDTTMLSNVLFGEGAIALLFGVIFAVGGSKASMIPRYPDQYSGQYYKKTADDHMGSRPREIGTGIVLMITAGILIALAVAITIMPSLTI